MRRRRLSQALAVVAIIGAAACGTVRRVAFSLDRARELDPSDPTRASRVADREKALNGERLQMAHAAYNVAYANARLGRAEAAIPFAEKAAASHQDMHELATTLLTALRKGG